MPHDVFICYSSRDKATADAVCATLESRKIRCWIAPRDVPPGQPWARTLARAIDASQVFVLVFSASANRSPHVMRELERAVNQGIPIIPFRIEDVQPSEDIGYFIGSIHWLDALTPPLERHAQKLGDTVQLLLTAEGEPQPPVVTPKPPPAAPPKPPRVRPALPHPWPTWAIPVIALIILLSVVGGGWWAVTKLQTRPTPTSALMPTDTPTVRPTPTSTPMPTDTPTVALTPTPTSTPRPTDTPTVALTPTPTSMPMPTDTPTVTPMPTPTSTPMPTDTPTVTPTPPPTSTPMPTDTPTMTPTPTVTPSPTPRATATPRPRTVTPTSVPQAAQPELVAPALGGEYQNPIAFEWDGSLSTGQAYQLTAYHPGSGYTVQSELLAAQSWSTHLPDDRFGEWRWSVSVVQDGSTVITSPEWMFWFNPFPGGGEETPGPPATYTPETTP